MSYICERYNYETVIMLSLTAVNDNYLSWFTIYGHFVMVENNFVTTHNYNFLNFCNLIKI